MILAAGLTPAWQQILQFDAFQAGEVNRAREVQWCGSGKVLNVGLALHHLGGPSRTLAMVGGTAGERICEEFKALRIDFHGVRSEVPTRTCTTILDRATGQTTELVENSAAVSAADLDSFTEAYLAEVRQADVVVLSGSLPAGTRTSYYRELLEKTPAHVVLDARGPELAEALSQQPFIVKPNREELERTLGRSFANERDLLDGLRELNRRGAEWVVVSAGAEPVWMANSDHTFRVYPPPVGDVVNPIGCGDSMAAGIAWALRDGQHVTEAVGFGIACAIDNLRQLLPARLNLERVREITSAVRIEAV